MNMMEHEGDWLSLGKRVAALLRADRSRIKAEIYNSIGIETGNHPAIVRRSSAAYRTIGAIGESDLALAGRISCMPLSVAEVILRWAGYDRNAAERSVAIYERGEIGLRGLIEQEKVSRRRSPTYRQNKIELVENAAIELIRCEYGDRNEFRIVFPEPPRRSHQGLEKFDLVGAGVDVIATWLEQEGPVRLAVIVLSSRPGDPGNSFRLRIQSTLWIARGLVHAKWRVVVVVYGEVGVEPFEAWREQVGVTVKEIRIIPGDLGGESVSDEEV